MTPADAIIDAEADRMKAAGEFMEFGGDETCNPSCKGWDGNSRRCDCGNRRVYWDWDDGDDGIVIYPVPD